MTKQDPATTDLTEEALENVTGGVYHEDGGCTPSPFPPPIVDTDTGTDTDGSWSNS